MKRERLPEAQISIGSSGGKANSEGVTAPAEGAGILDAVVDQSGDLWIRYGTKARSIWFAVRDLLQNEKIVLKRLTSIGVVLLTDVSKRAFRKAIEAHKTFRAGIVASHPGWFPGSIYVFPDGTHISPNDDVELIVGFETVAKFGYKGTVGGWQSRVGPVVSRQPLALVTLGYGLIGPLLHYVPADYHNPQLELVGDHETGKTTLAVSAASMWGGNPASKIGAADSWDLTLNAIDPLKIERCDGLLVLDDTSHLPDNQNERGKILELAVFKLGTTGVKKRYTDVEASPHSRLAFLSTSNTPLSDLLKSKPGVRAAAESRLVTLAISSTIQPHGVLSRVPDDFPSARAAIEFLEKAINLHYGKVSRRFVRGLMLQAEKDEPAFRAYVADLLKRFVLEFQAFEPHVSSARIQKTFALIFVAGILAQRMGVLPKSWGSFKWAIKEVVKNHLKSGPLVTDGALEQVTAYIRSHISEVSSISDLKRPLTRAELGSKAGFTYEYEGRSEVLIPAIRLRQAFPNHLAIMRQLRDRGMARCEGGQRKKLTIKAPKALASSGRVYCIRLDVSALAHARARKSKKRSPSR